MLKLCLIHAADAVFLYMIDMKPYEEIGIDTPELWTPQKEVLHRRE
jgi:hypothetical protein